MKHSRTWKLAILTALLSPAAASAAPLTVTGNNALALAAVVAPYSPLSGCDKKAMARLFAGDINFRFPANKRFPSPPTPSCAGPAMSISRRAPAT